MGSGGYHVGGLYIELCAVGKESVGVKLSYLHYRLVLALRALEHFVIARIAVGSKVAYIGDVHYALNVQTRVSEVFFQNVLHYIAAQVAYMRIVVNGRSAGVHTQLTGFVGY